MRRHDLTNRFWSLVVDVGDAFFWLGNRLKVVRPILDPVGMAVCNWGYAHFDIDAELRWRETR